jgi:hypothetical protein
MGPPQFPRDPSGDMPRSETPVGSHPLTITRLGLRPSGCWRPSAFPLHRVRGILLSTIIGLAGLHHAACLLGPSSFVRP